MSTTGRIASLNWLVRLNRSGASAARAIKGLDASL